MHTHEKWLRDDAWQDVVDGQLTRDELQQLVALCDQHPELWQRCAIAFLEEQVLEQELKGLASNWPTMPDAALIVESSAELRGLKVRGMKLGGLERHARGDAVDQGLVHAKSDRASSADEGLGGKGDRTAPQAPIATAARKSAPSTSNPVPHSALLNNLTLAASVTLAFFIGWQASRRMRGEMTNHSPGSVVSGVMPTVADRSSTTPRVGSHAPSHGNAAHDIQLAGSPAQVGTPMQTAEEFAADAITEALQSPDRFVPIDRRIPRELEDLEQRGLLRLESTEGFVPVLLKDGSTAVVPFQQINVRPKRNAY